MSNARQVADEYRMRLRVLDAKAAMDAVRGYDKALTEVNRQIRKLQTLLENAEAAGVKTTEPWLVRQAEYQDLASQIGQQMSRFAASLNGAVTAAQRDAIQLAIQEAEAVLIANRGAQIAAHWVSLSPTAVEYMIAQALQGPLKAALSGFGDQAWVEVSDALTTAVTTGQNPRVVAGKIRRALEISRWRALTISRTEILRAHRYATQEALKANPRVIQGWVWLSAMDDRTCAYCWAMTGSHHDADDPMASHPNCRCTQVPDTKGWDEILTTPVPEDSPDASITDLIPDGEEAFSNLPDASQEQILGAKAYKLYKAGSLSLADLVGTRYSREYGRTGYTKSVRQVEREKRVTV